MNLYTRLSQLNDEIGSGTASVNDEMRLRVAERAARAIDSYTHRHFYSRTATVLCDGHRVDRLWLSDDPTEPDIVSLSSVKIDQDGDGVFETTLTADTDYWLWPDNRPTHQPAYRIDINPTSSYRFPIGRRRIQLVGKFGYSEETQSAGTLGAAIASTTVTTMTLNDGHDVQAGDTDLIDSEQVYVSAIEANTATIVRGVNGTTAATHLDDAAVSLRVYPSEIVQAAQMQAVRWLWNAQRGYEGSVMTSEGTSGYITAPSLYPQIRDILQRFARLVSI